MKILVLDNYDSFTYNLVHALEKILGSKVDVYRNDKIALEDVKIYDKIVLSPGPGLPVETGILLDLIRMYAPSKSILGVCLGHQAIGEAFGGKLLNLSRVYHGVSTEMIMTNNDEPMFKGLDRKFMAGRYHSWIVDKTTLPDCFDITAEDSEGKIMAMHHKKYDVRGVQFHPESVLTPSGLLMIENWVKK